MKPQVSVVVATYDRGELLLGLLEDLAAQTIAHDRFEVVVVDDGSRVPARRALEGKRLPYSLSLVEQENQGAAAARHVGIARASGIVVVIVDDDMRVGADFLERHLAAHERGSTLVLGLIDDEGSRMPDKPLFERMHANLLARQWVRFRTGEEPPRGIHVCTGNVSFRRADYFAVGGFDPTLARSEDRELGVRLEKAGARLEFAHEARTVHRSDVSDVGVWLRRNFLYGVYDLRIARKHPDVESADPWRYAFMVNPLSRVLVGVTLAVPPVGGALARSAMRVAMALDHAGAEKAAIAGATVCFTLEYFRGLRNESGSLWEAARGLRAYLRKRRASRP